MFNSENISMVTDGKSSDQWSPEQLGQLYNEMQTLVKSKNAQSSEFIEKMEKMDRDLKAYDEKNQELIGKLKEEEKKSLEFKNKMESLERAIYEMPRNSGESKKLLECKELIFKAMQQGIHSLDANQIKTLRTDIDPDGGFLVEQDVMPGVIKDLSEISPVRQFATVKTTSYKTTLMNLRTTIPTGGFAGELEERAASNATYSQRQFTLHRLNVITAISREQLKFANVNMVDEMANDAMEEMAKLSGEAFVTGTGDVGKKPLGFTVDAQVRAGAVNSGLANDLTWSSLIYLESELKSEQYPPLYAFNRKTLGRIRNLIPTSGDGHFLWTPGDLRGAVPATINGVPYSIFQDMPDIAPNAYPILFGDLRQGYVIGDYTGVTIIRDDVTRKTAGLVEFLWEYLVGGTVRQPAALKLMKIAV